MSDVNSAQAHTGRAHSDAETIGLVGLAHGTSHFFHLLLPPLFPLLVRDHGYTYTELGVLVSLFFVISGIGQALAGFVVDRVGALPVLLGAMVAFTLAAVSAAVSHSYAGLMLAAALAGLGNAPFHPADFTILNQRVSAPRLGHAFSIHGVSGNLGWAAAPILIAGVTALTDSWRWAMAACAAWALLVLGLLVWRAAALQGGGRPQSAGSPVGASSPGQAESSPFAFLRLPSVWVCFMFFFWSTCALAAIQSFVAPAMSRLYGEPLPWVALMVTGYMACSAAGMLTGGFLVKGGPRLERNIALSLGAASLLLMLAGTGWMPAMVAGALVALAGFGSGLAGPSRDMLIRQAAPAGATGRVYGTVYSGLDVGFAAAAPVFGALLDHGASGGVLFGAAAALALGIASAAWVGRQVQAKPASLATSGSAR